MSLSLRAALCSLVMLVPAAAELPAPTTARLLNLISKGAGENGRVACNDAALAAELAKVGSETTTASRVAWAATPGEVKMLSMGRKCVVTNDPRLFSQGAAVAVYEDGGRVKVAINQKAVAQSGVTLSDQILKVAVAQ